MTVNKYTRGYNSGIGILRAVACWLVIVSHFWIYSPDTVAWHYPLNMFRQLAVPVFMTLTFYFGGTKLMNTDPQWLKKRLERICVPIIVWSVISFAVVKVALFPTITLKQLVIQILTGSVWEINFPMWFMNALLIVTLILFAISLLPPKLRVVTFCLALILSVTIQYNQIVLALVKYDKASVEIYTIRLLILRCFLMIPYALAGILCSRYNLFDKLKRLQWYYLVSIALGLFIVYFTTYTYEIDSLGISYVGASPWIGCAAMILLFLSLSRLIKTEKSKHTVKILTSYTLGIYLMHLPVGRILGEILAGGG